MSDVTYVGRFRPEGLSVWRVRGGVAVELNPRYDLRRHSPTGFAAGYGGSGPAQLALAILADATGDDRLAQGLYQAFKGAVIARLPQEESWQLARAGVLDWVARQPLWEGGPGV